MQKKRQKRLIVYIYIFFSAQPFPKEITVDLFFICCYFFLFFSSFPFQMRFFFHFQYIEDVKFKVFKTSYI